MVLITITVFVLLAVLRVLRSLFVFLLAALSDNVIATVGNDGRTIF